MDIDLPNPAIRGVKFFRLVTHFTSHNCFFIDKHSSIPLDSVKMSSAYGVIAKPETNGSLDSVLPIRETLRNGSDMVVEAVDPNNEPLVQYMHKIFNAEIEDG